MAKTLILQYALMIILSVPVFGQDEAGAPMFSGRSGVERQRLLELYGGTAETEKAVEQGLHWLSRQQRKDGSWSLKGPHSDGGLRDNRTAATSMALLAFMGAGYTHRDGGYKQDIDSGMRWLVAQQSEDGFFASEETAHQQSYAHAQASIAVVELYAMTGDLALQQPVQLAIHYAEEWQGPVGGWRYSPRAAGDMSVTGWYVMTLQSGLAAGLALDQSVTVHLLFRTSDFQFLRISVAGQALA
jgi:squalene cyclase